MGIISEFRAFILKGNMIDMAVGIIIGAAFGTVVKSLVDDVIMPPVGQLVGGVDFSDIVIPLSDPGPKPGDGAAPEEIAAWEKASKSATIKIGNFINNLISLLIVGAAVFMLVKVVNKAQTMFDEQEEEAKPAEPSEDILLLREIRDSLKND